MSTKSALRLLVAAALLFLSTERGFAAEASSASVFYVAPGGNDAWSGRLPQANAARTDGPLATLQRARELTRKVGAGQAKRVVVRGGSYFLERNVRLGTTGFGHGGAAGPVASRRE